METNELKIELYPEKKPRYDFEKEPIQYIIEPKTLGHSFNENQTLAYIDKNVPVLNGFYTAHNNHYPIRIKPDDIWLLIVQAFSHHVNSNSEKLRKYFVNFDGKKELTIKYPLSSIEQVDKKVLEDFSEKINEEMTKYLGKEILETLTPNFTTSTYDSIIIGKITIMGAFKKYFDYRMGLCGCGIPYIILEGTTEDYEKIKSKALELKKYEFDWYIDRIIPHIEKMIDAKKGKIDIDFFKDIIQKKEVTQIKYGPSGIEEGQIQVEYVSGWFLNFLGFYAEEDYKGRLRSFTYSKINVKDFEKLANQMLIVPFIIDDIVHKKQYSMKYKVGFIGCDKNEKDEVFPVQGWLVSPYSEEEKESINKKNRRFFY